MADLRLVCDGLRFPEGPIAMDDGSVVVVEIQSGTLARVSPDGDVTLVAETGGGPNGAAIGPDGKVYVCNNGGFEWHEFDGMTVPGPAAGRLHRRPDPARRPRHGRGRRPLHRVRRVRAARPERHRLRRPRRLLVHRPRQIAGPARSTRAGVYYAAADGSSIKNVVYALDTPTASRLSPDGSRCTSPRR